MASTAQNIYNARLAEQGERFEDMVTYMKAVVKVRSFKYICKLNSFGCAGWSPAV